MTEQQAAELWNEAGRNIREIDATATRHVVEELSGWEWPDESRESLWRCRQSWIEAANLALQVHDAVHQERQAALYEASVLLATHVLVRRRWYHNLADRLWRLRLRLAKWIAGGADHE